MARILEENLIALLEVLPAGWTLTSYQRSTHGWTALMGFKNQRFMLTSEWNYIRVDETVGKKRKKPRPILPPDDQRINQTASQVCALMMSAVTSKTPRPEISD